MSVQAVYPSSAATMQAPPPQVQPQGTETGLPSVFEMARENVELKKQKNALAELLKRFLNENENNSVRKEYDQLKKELNATNTSNKNTKSDK